MKDEMTLDEIITEHEELKTRVIGKQADIVQHETLKCPMCGYYFSSSKIKKGSFHSVSNCACNQKLFTKE